MAKILIIDDEIPVRVYLRQILEGVHEVLEAANGKVGLRLYWEHMPDLVITDILMPEKDGVEVIMELVDQAPGVKIIAISGGGRGLDANFNLRVAQDFGALRALAKPFTRREVLDLVNDLLGG
ncbi:MAG: response regulator [Magnetococcales bacterium]|nr:response regulator [Magnetococcales bacterium]